MSNPRPGLRRRARRGLRTCLLTLTVGLLAAAPWLVSAPHGLRLPSSGESVHDSTITLGPPADGPGSRALDSPGAAYRWNNLSALLGQASPPQPPGSTFGAAMAWDAADDYLLLLEPVPGAATTATWSYLNGTWTNLTSSVSGHPPNFNDSAMAYDPSLQSVVLFGGLSTDGWISDVWTYHDRLWTNASASFGALPPADQFPSMAWDSAASELVLVGSPYLTSSQTWLTWTLTNSGWHNATVPLPLGFNAQWPRLADDPPEGGVLLSSSAQIGPLAAWRSETYVYQSGAWVNLTASNPVGPICADDWTPPMAYLAESSEVVLASDACSRTGPPQSQTWFFVDGQWTNATSQVGYAPGETLAPAAGALPDDGAYLEFGGWRPGGLGVTDSTWVLSAPPTVAETLSATVVDAGTDVDVSGSVDFGLDPNLATIAWGDGGTAPGSNGSHAYAAGLYAPTLQVTDLIGQVGESSQALLVDPAPVATITVATPAPVSGSPTVLIGGVLGGTAPYTLNWTLGDGTTASGGWVDHRYARPGSFTVSLSVVDAAGGRATATATLVVASPPATLFPWTAAPAVVLVVGVAALAVLASVLAVIAVRSRRGRGPAGAATPPDPTAR